MPEKEIIIEIALERLRDFPGSPFSVAMDEPMQDLIESIRIYGILNPLIVRPMPDGCYQIISGHRRKFAAVKLRYRKVPVIIRALNDDEALVAMVDSNLQREKIRISEKAFAYRMKYDVVKREGKHPKEYFYGEKYHGIKTIEFMGKEQKDSPLVGLADLIGLGQIANWVVSRPDIRKYNENRQQADVYINPPLPDYEASSFGNEAMRRMIAVGEEAARSQWSKLEDIRRMTEQQ